MKNHDSLPSTFSFLFHLIQKNIVICTYFSFTMEFCFPTKNFLCITTNIKLIKTFTFTFGTDISHSTLSILGSLYVCLFCCFSVTVLHTLLLSIACRMHFPNYVLNMAALSIGSFNI